MVKVHYSSRQTSGNRVGNYRKPTNKAERKPDIDVKYALDMGKLAKHYVEIKLAMNFDEGLDMAEGALDKEQ